MKKTIYKIALSMVAITLPLASCVKDELYNTPYPDNGRVLVTTDWSAKSAEADVPDSYTLQIGEQSRQVTGESNLFEPLLSPGSYKLLVHNTPSDITVSGTTAAVHQAASGIAPMPGYLFASLQDIYVEADDTLKVTAPMQQYVRRIDIELTVKEGDYSRVASAKATLSGVASAVDISTAERGNPSETTNAMEHSGDRFTVSFRLLGIINSATNNLTVEVLFANGDKQTVVSDLSTTLGDFNSTVEPLKLNGELFLPVEGGISGFISSWEIADGGNIDAH